MQTLDQWFLSLVKRSARGQSVAQNGSEKVFALCWQVRAVVLFILAGCGLLLFGLTSSSPIPGHPWYLKPILVAIVGGLPVAILLALPGRVVIDSSGITQRFWWRPERCMPWSDFLPLLSTTEMTDPRLFTASSSLRLLFLPTLSISRDLIAR
jgi:hypothetical protein